MLEAHPASGDRPERAQSFRDRSGVDAGADRARGGGQRVAHVVHAGHGQVDVDQPERRRHRDARAVRAQRVGRRDDRVGLDREVDDAPGPGDLPPDRRAGVVGREHGHAVIGQRQRGDDFAVLVRRRLDRPHELLVLALRVVDQRDGGTHEFGEIGDLADVVHAEFEHGGAVLPGELPQHQRHADVVVEVAPRRQATLVAVRRRQDRGDHLRDRGLAVASGHRDDRQREPRAPLGCRESERAPAVRHDDLRQVDFDDALHQRGRRAALARRGDVVVAIEALAAQRDVERAGRERPRVGRHAREADAAVAPRVQRRHRAGEFADGHQRAHWTTLRAARAGMSASERPCALTGLPSALRAQG